MNNKQSVLDVYLVLSVFVTLVTLIRLTLIPADPKNAILWGFSPFRLILMSGVFLLFVLLSSITIWLMLVSSFKDKTISFINDRIFGRRAWRVFLPVTSFLGLILSIAIHLIPATRLGVAEDQIQRVLPLVDWSILIACQTIVAQYIWLDQKILWGNVLQWKQVLIYTAVSAALLFVLAGIIVWTRIGIEPDRSGWYPPGTPILISQVLLALCSALVIVFLIGKIENRTAGLQAKIHRWINVKAIICITLWLTACLAWWAEPMKKPSYFAPPPVPPNNEYYPYSDGAEYDGYAQEVLIGKGDAMGLLRRPLYAFFLAGLHVLAGQDYDRILFLQTMVLGAIPVLIYLLTCRFSNRTAGLMAAVMVILRERNAIALTNVIEESHSKLLLSEMPTMALMLVLILLLVRWLEKPDRNPHLAVTAGGVLGAMILIRSQCLLIVPAVIVCAIWFHLPGLRKMVQGLLLLSLGLSIMVIPWVVRNYQVSGRLVVEDTGKYIDLFASGYTLTPSEIVRRIPGESAPEHYDRMQAQIIDFILTHPAEVARFYTSHFVHNEISTIIYLPLTPVLFDLRSYISQMRFWGEPLSALPSGSFAWLLINLGLIAVGMGSSYWKSRAIVFIPIIMSIAYSSSIITARLSSGRFILPIDWISIFFYSIGVVQLGLFILSLFTDRAIPILMQDGQPPNPERVTKANGKIIGFTLLIISLLGLGFPLLTKIIPPRYPVTTPAELIRKQVGKGLITDNGLSISAEDLRTFLERQDTSVILYGRALYPSYYKEGDYWGDENIFNVEARKYSRLQFNLIGPRDSLTFIPLKSPPVSFPQAADVLVIGCLRRYGIEAIAVRVEDQPAVLAAFPWPGLVCIPSSAAP
jgi:hypothetical protein